MADLCTISPTIVGWAGDSLEGALLLLGGFTLLFIGGELLVKGSIALANRFQLGPVTIGLTVVAAATSLPELVVSLIAQKSGSTDLVVGNVLGSNIFNIAVVLGFGTFLLPLPSSPMIRRFQFPALLGVTILLPAIFYFQEYAGAPGSITPWIGVFLLLTLVLILGQSLRWSRRESERKLVGLIEDEITSAGKEKPLALTLAISLTGALLLWFGGELLVEGALQIVTALEVEEGIVGLTVVAAGTGAPELFATIASLRHGVAGLALGNVIGSNLFNLLAIFGCAAIVSPIQVPLVVWDLDLLIHALFTLTLLLILSGRFHHRVAGGIFIASYAGYLVFLSTRG